MKNSDTFVDTDLLHARGVGRAALNGFVGAGWIVVVEPIAADHQSFRLTSFGREALAAVLRYMGA